MSLLDHFHSPLSDRKSWEGFHGQWPAVIVQQLRSRLPEPYEAEPRVHLGAQAEIDIATFEQEAPGFPGPGSDDGGVATAVWAPAQPTLTVETDLADCDEYEVRIFDSRHGRRLVAAIEIISPANKDRAEHRQVFTAKCAGLLRSGVSLVLVDIVTSRDFNLYAELLELIGQRDPDLGQRPPATYAVACCWRARGISRWLNAWYQPLAVGQPLPTLPLWLSEDLGVPLDLNASYEQTCRDLWITK